MRTFIAMFIGAVLGAVAVFGALPAAPAYSYETQMRAEAIPTVRIVTSSAEGGCSAVVVAPGYALSAQHCKGLPNMKVDGHAVAKIREYSSKDIVLLEVPGLGCPCASIAPTDAAPGERVAAVGFPYGIGPHMTYGESQGNVLFEGEQYLLHTAGTSPGMSGGGVFGIREGRVVLVAITSRSATGGLAALSVNVSGLSPQLRGIR